MDHSFNVALADKIGVDASVIVHHFFFWILKNKANEKHLHDGRYWTYNSNKAIAELFPYMSQSKIFRILKRLENEGLIAKDNFNKDPRDRTCWYAFTEKGINLLKSTGYDIDKISSDSDCKMHSLNLKNAYSQNEVMHITKTENAYHENEEPLPDIIYTDNKENTTKVVQKKDAAKAATLTRRKEFYDSLVPFVGKYSKEMIRNFFDYWSELNKSCTKMKFELEKTWEVSLRLATWARREKTVFNKNSSDIVLKDNSIEKFKGEKGW